MGSMDLQCTHSAKLDLQLIVDSSLSVGKEKFQLLMEVHSNLIADFLNIKTRIISNISSTTTATTAATMMTATRT